jgi:hypothetical protein
MAERTSAASFIPMLTLNTDAVLIVDSKLV